MGCVVVMACCTYFEHSLCVYHDSVRLFSRQQTKILANWETLTLYYFIVERTSLLKDVERRIFVRLAVAKYFWMAFLRGVDIYKPGFDIRTDDIQSLQVGFVMIRIRKRAINELIS